VTAERSGDPVSRLLHLQASLGLAGGAVWLVGAALHHDFVNGVGVGLVAAAILLRFTRGAQEDAVDSGVHEDASGRGMPAAAEGSGARSD